MNKIYIYGNSWVRGCELSQFVPEMNHAGKDVPYLAFPARLQELLNIEVINRGVTGSSVVTMVYQFIEQIPSTDDLAIFCCTAKTRRTFFTEDGNKVEHQFLMDDMIRNNREDHEVHARTLTLLYLLCKNYNVPCYFLHEFDTYNIDNPVLNVIPEDNWLIPKNKSICSEVFDNEFFNIYDNHHMGNFLEWIESKNENSKEYIKPCVAHPNIKGHQAIAEYISNQLQRRIINVKS